MFGFRIPSYASVRESSHSGGVAHHQDFALVNLVHFDVPVGTSQSHFLFTCTRGETKDLGVGVSEEIDDPRFASGCRDKLYFPWLEMVFGFFQQLHLFQILAELLIQILPFVSGGLHY